MKFDDILGYLGYSGLYQTLLVVVLSIVLIPTTFHQLVQIFFAANVDFWCSYTYKPETNCSSNWNMTSERCDQAVQNFVRLTKNYNCKEFANITVQSLLDVDEHIDNWPVWSCNRWTYDTSQYETTIIQEWDLVCDNSTKPAVAQAVFFAGVLVGSMFFGALADRIGRRTVLIIGIVLVGTSSLAVSFSPSYIVYTLLRFVVAFANIGIIMQISVMTTEWVGPAQRKYTVMLIGCIWSVGCMILALLAYYIPRWRPLSIVISLSTLIFLFLIPFVPESPRWLIMKGRFAEARKTIEAAAKFNKVTLPDQQLFDDEEKLKKSAVAQGNIADLYRTPNMRSKSLILMFVWFVNSCVYYGLSLSTSDLGVNDYIAFMVSSAVEIPANILLMLVVDRAGRRPCLFLSMVIGGVACIISFFMPTKILRIITAMCGKFSITFSFSLSYLFSKEIFPTTLRSTGLGVSSTSARVGGILSPFILLVKDAWEPLPYILFGCLSISAGVLGLLLPETTGKKLPDTVEDGERDTESKKTSNMKGFDEVKTEEPVVDVAQMRF